MFRVFRLFPPSVSIFFSRSCSIIGTILLCCALLCQRLVLVDRVAVGRRIPWIAIPVICHVGSRHVDDTLRECSLLGFDLVVDDYHGDLGRFVRLDDLFDAVLECRASVVDLVHDQHLPVADPAPDLGMLVEPLDFLDGGSGRVGGVVVELQGDGKYGDIELRPEHPCRDEASPADGNNHGGIEF